MEASYQKQIGVGVMSGSSLDGLDLAICSFTYRITKDPQRRLDLKGWEILAGETVPFTAEWAERLRTGHRASGLELAFLHTDFGRFVGRTVPAFIERSGFNPAYIASHGHTIFHAPESGMTCQVGDGGTIASTAGILTISDFRNGDIAKDGQGTPLAPIADKFLFPGYQFYLNLGGIANISFLQNDRWEAFDVGPANQVLNHLAQRKGLEYDRDGVLAAAGQLQMDLLDRLNGLPFFAQPHPKSLDNTWIKEQIIPLFAEDPEQVDDQLRTACEQLAFQIAEAVHEVDLPNSTQPPQMLVTGGGACNLFLVECIRRHCAARYPLEVVVPDALHIHFKEASLMALLGLLRIEQVPSILPSVTGARKSTIAGAVYLP
ncbi:MAG: anhydro-N-acetylmuramic acid kinase [Bacteroidota bacterium]